MVVQVAGTIYHSYGTIYNGICTFFWISRRRLHNLKFKGALKIYLLWCVVNGFNGDIVVNIQHSIPFSNYHVCHPYVHTLEKHFTSITIIMAHINYHPLSCAQKEIQIWHTGKEWYDCCQTYWPFKCHIKKLCVFSQNII